MILMMVAMIFYLLLKEHLKNFRCYFFLKLCCSDFLIFVYYFHFNQFKIIKRVIYYAMMTSINYLNLNFIIIMNLFINLIICFLNFIVIDLFIIKLRNYLFINLFICILRFLPNHTLFCH